MKKSNNGLTVIVNNENPEVSDATLPFKWQLSDELCRLKPEYMLIVTSASNRYRQRRYLVKISDAECFVEFFREGGHEIFCFLLNPLNFDKKEAREIQETHRKLDGGLYEYTRPVECERTLASLNGYILQDQFAIAGLKFEVDMPNELFAKKPKTGLPKFFYNIVNTGWKFEPIHQCEYRKRILISMLTPHFWSILFARILMGILSILVCLSILSVRLFVAFIGFRPRTIWADWKHIFHTYVMEGRFADLSEAGVRIAHFKPQHGQHWTVLWRVWKNPNGDKNDLHIGHDHRKADGSLFIPKRIWVTPVGVVGIIYFLWLSISSQAYAGTFLGALSFGIALANVGIVALRIIRPKRKFLHVWVTDTTGYGSLDDDIQSFDKPFFVAVIAGFGYLCWLYPLILPFALLAGVVGFLILRLRSNKKRFPRVNIRIPQWLTGLSKKLEERKHQRQLAFEKQKEEQLALRQKQFELWMNQQRSLATEARPALAFVQESTEPCDPCENRTLGDKVRLTFHRVKAKVCKPFPA